MRRQSANVTDSNANAKSSAHSVRTSEHHADPLCPNQQHPLTPPLPSPHHTEWCRPDQFICPEAKQCVDRSALCDGRFDCADGADERHCVTLAASAAAAEADTGRYSAAGLLLVRKRGVWGRLCVDRLDGVVRQSRGSWGADELGRAVCKALTYQ